jgi:hypothetical protein
LVKTLFGTLDADVAVVPASGATLPEGWGAYLEGMDDVAAWAPVLEDECVVRANDQVRVASLLGVDKRYVEFQALTAPSWKARLRQDQTPPWCHVRVWVLGSVPSSN